MIKQAKLIWLNLNKPSYSDTIIKEVIKVELNRLDYFDEKISL
jgi:hypothetical protein